MASENVYRTPIVRRGSKRWVYLLVVLPFMAGLLLYLWVAAPTRTSVVIALVSAAGGLALAALVLRSSVNIFVLDMDKLVDRSGTLRREFPFADIIAVLSVAGAGGGLATHIFRRYENASDAAYSIPSLVRTSFGERLARWIRGLSAAGTGRHSTFILSRTERYPELVSEVLRRSRGAATDPFTRIVAGFAGLVPSYDTEYRRPSYARGVRGVGDTESVRLCLGRFELREAERLLGGMVEADPHNAETWTLLGKVHVLLGKMGNAEDDLQRAADLRAGDHDIVFHRGLARFYRRKFSEAQADFREADELRPDDPLTIAYLGCSNGRVGKWQDAQTTLLKLDKQSSPMSQTAMKCLECTADSRELADSGKSDERRTHSQRIQVLAFLLVLFIGAMEAVLREIHATGTIRIILAVIAFVGLGLGRTYVERFLSMEPIASVPCWLQLQWMKDEKAER